MRAKIRYEWLSLAGETLESTFKCRQQRFIFCYTVGSVKKSLSKTMFKLSKIVDRNCPNCICKNNINCYNNKNNMNDDNNKIILIIHE